jgi:hypothetical protein
VTAVIMDNWGGDYILAENFEVNFGEGCMRNMQCNISVSTNSTFALELVQGNLWMIYDMRLPVLVKPLSCPRECVVFQHSKQKSDDLLYLRVVCFVLDLDIDFTLIFFLSVPFTSTCPARLPSHWESH